MTKTIDPKTIAPKTPVYLHKPAMICALGNTTDAIAKSLFADEAKALTSTDCYTPGRPLPVGAVNADLPNMDAAAPEHQTRNNQLLLAAANQIETQINELKQHFAHNRIGIVLGTSTSGIAEAEAAIAEYANSQTMPTNFRYEQQEIGAPAQFLAKHLQLSGPATTISTACSSGAKALVSAQRLINAGICDAVICGGVDSLCKLTLNGFSALASISETTCNPFSLNRDGINIGEAACLFVLSSSPSGVVLSGNGESSDAHHISAPHPQGIGAITAMQTALKSANLQPEQIDYINLHGTATPKNDAMESLAVNTVFGSEVNCSSTKPVTGHTLGAAGALEAGLCWLTLNQNGQLPIQWWDAVTDPDISSIKLVTPTTQLSHKPKHVLSNSFAFGGNNISIILSAATEVDA